MQDDIFFAVLGLHTAEALSELRALSEVPRTGANVVPFLPRRARSCRSGVASRQSGVIVLLPQRGKPVAPETMTKEM